MTQTNDATSQPLRFSLTQRMLAGAAVGMAVISFFLIMGKPDPAWGTFWRIRPLVVGPFAGAMGGLCNYFIMRFHSAYGIHKIIAGILSLFVFTIGMWMGIVLGFSGTYWN